MRCTQSINQTPDVILYAVQVGIAKPAEVIDYMRLPPPIKYEELQRESMSTSCLLYAVHISLPCCIWKTYLAHCKSHLPSVFIPFFLMICLRLRAVTLKPELFEGLRFDFTKPLNQNFALCHR